MKQFKDIISLVQNSRGCYILDTIKGCSICGTTKPQGCYGECYAYKIATRYGIDFTKVIKRDFVKQSSQIDMFDPDYNENTHSIINAIKNNSMPFVRIGEMGDPSEDWEHTLRIAKIIALAGKPIVIITKHWKTLTETQLLAISKLNICINTSISAMDSENEITHRLYQFNKLKNYCTSVLRIVSCDFNITNDEGNARAILQERLFENDFIIDTVFRPSENNILVKSGIINIEKTMFLKSKVWASVYNKNQYLGRCETCPDLCGLRFMQYGYT